MHVRALHKALSTWDARSLAACIPEVVHNMVHELTLGFLAPCPSLGISETDALQLGWCVGYNLHTHTSQP